jgi:hypothetical protein
MKTFVTLLRQDLHAIRWILPLAIIAWISPLLVVEHTRTMVKFGFSGYVTYLVASISHLLIVGRVLFSSPAADPGAEWRIRPIHPLLVLLEKLLLCTILVGLLPQFVRAAAASVLPHGGADLASFQPDLLWRILLLLLAIAWLASMCRTSGQFLVALGIALIAMIWGTSLLFSAFRQVFHGISEPAAWIVWPAAVTAALAILAAQYRHPHRWRTLTLGLLLGGLLLAALIAFPKYPRRATDAPRTVSPTAAVTL